MFRLADESTLERVEGALYKAREFRTALASWWWNALGILFVIVSFGAFLYARSTAPPPREEKRIEFQPQTWYSASRGLYAHETAGQTPPLEFGGGLEPASGAYEQSPAWV